MLIRKPDSFTGSNIPSSEITPKEKWLNRRSFIASAAITGAIAVGAARAAEMLAPRSVEAAGKLQTVKSPLSTTGEELTSLRGQHLNWWGDRTCGGWNGVIPNSSDGLIATR